MSLLFVGPLPPPVHGFSLINQRMLARCRSETEVQVFDRAVRRTAPGATIGRLQDLIGLLAAFAGTVRLRKHRTLYIGLSGGFGQLLDLPFILIARFAGLRIYVHHHSFAYLNSPSFVSRLVMGALAGAHHIVLGQEMAEKIADVYRVERLTVLSNIAFTEAQLETRVQREASDLIHIGFLSNITEEKGIFAFLDALEACRSAGIKVRATIAGPVAPEISERLRRELARFPEATAIGPIYDAAKSAFFADIDWLFFPTLYKNEAEPVTILEALSQGVHVLANRRGCIQSMLANGLGHCCDEAEFRDYAVRLLGRFATYPDTKRAELRSEIMHRTNATRAGAEKILLEVTKALSHG